MLEKSFLRARARAHRKALAATLPDAATALSGFYARLSDYNVISVYIAMGDELDPEPLARNLLAAGASLCLPVVEMRAQPLVFRAWVPGDPLVRDVAGCLAPLPTAPATDPDLILTPLLAFDRVGTRLGQGGGYYDRTFEARTHVARIGLAYADQEVERLPAEAHDMSLQGVLTERGFRALGLHPVE